MRLGLLRCVASTERLAGSRRIAALAFSLEAPDEYDAITILLRLPSGWAVPVFPLDKIFRPARDGIDPFV